MDNNEKLDQLPIEEQENNPVAEEQKFPAEETAQVDNTDTREVSKEEIQKERKKQKNHQKNEAPKERAPKKEKASKEPKQPMSPAKIRGVAAWAGIAALCIAGVASLIAALLPSGGLNYAILGMLCITSAVSLVIQLAILDSKAKEAEPKAEAVAEKNDCEQDKLKEYELAAAKLQIAALEKELEKEKAILGSLFELTDYLPKNERFHQERNRQYEAASAVLQIKKILEKAEMVEDLKVRGQYIEDIQAVIARFDKKTGENE